MSTSTGDMVEQQNMMRGMKQVRRTQCSPVRMGHSQSSVLRVSSIATKSVNEGRQDPPDQERLTAVLHSASMQVRLPTAGACL
jgi:hypothetical protein